jgi:hypothetical protein
MTQTLIKITLLLASTLTVMAGATIAPSLPAMQDHFSEIANSQFLVKLILTIPALFIALGSPLAGQIFNSRTVAFLFKKFNWC